MSSNVSYRPNGGCVQIKEQFFTDHASGLTLQFEQRPCGEFGLRIMGDALPFGNRELIFSADGELVATGTFTGAACRPAWRCNPEEL